MNIKWDKLDYQGQSIHLFIHFLCAGFQRFLPPGNIPRPVTQPARGIGVITGCLQRKGENMTGGGLIQSGMFGVIVYSSSCVVTLTVWISGKHHLQHEPTLQLVSLRSDLPSCRITLETYRSCSAVADSCWLLLFHSDTLWRRLGFARSADILLLQHTKHNNNNNITAQ